MLNRPQNNRLYKKITVTDNQKPLITRDMKMSDLYGVAELHKHCFKSDISIFSALNPEILKRYYGMFVEEPESFAAVLEEPASGSIVGFAFGTLKPGIQKRFLHRYYLIFLWNILKGIFTGKSMWKSLWSRLRKSNVSPLGNLREYDSQLANAGVPPPEGPEDLCMGIGVHRDFRGGGNAAKLLDYYIKRVFEKGAVRVRGAVLVSNTPSMTFFKNRGWEFRRISDAQVSIWLDRPKKV
jgi:GNAT superfamily N-acetyltransferase